MLASHEKAEDKAALEALRSERDSALDRIATMELQIKTAERTLSERDSKLDSLQRTVQQSTTDLESQKSESANRVKELQSKVDDHEALVQELKAALETKQGRESENDAVVKAKNAEIALLQSRVDKAYVDFDNERKDLLGQVTELREAGQVMMMSIYLSKLPHYSHFL
jgi:CAP-Gly domain-containing linker protein 1